MRLGCGSCQKLPNMGQAEPEVPWPFIGRPQTLAKTCPIETYPRILPHIKAPAQNKKKSKVSERTSLNSELVKFGVNLPKLKTVKSGEGRDPFIPPSYHLTLSQNVKTSDDLFAFHPSNMQQDRNPAYNTCAVVPSRCLMASSDLSCEEFKVTEEEEGSSNALKQWELWMARKKRLQDHLSKSLDRSPCELLLQAPDKRRKAIEEKILFHYVKIPPADKLMGHPYQWRPEIRLGSKKSNDDDRTPQYFAVKTKSYEGLIPDMEFVGIPLEVQKEKGLICDGVSRGVNSANKLWQESDYRKKWAYKYRKQLKKMKPHDIEMDDLIILGKKIPQEKEEEEQISFEVDVPRIEITEVGSGEEEASKDQGSFFSLVIGSVEIKYEIGSQVDGKNKETCTWEIDFGVNFLGSLVEKSLRVENRGTVAVSYRWESRKIEHAQNLQPLQPKQHEPWFFFNKNSGVFVPGEISHLKFYHFSKRAGVRTETWYLKTNPPLSGSENQGKFILLAVASIPSLETKTEALEAFLSRKIAETTVRFLLDRVIHIVSQQQFGLRQLEYRSMFLEKDLFEYHNPQHYYHPKEVNHLHQLFKESLANGQQEWDFSLQSLLEMVRTTTEEKEKEGLLQRISILANLLLKPNFSWGKMKESSYRMVYQVFCGMTNNMEEDYFYLRECFCKKRCGGADWEEFEGYESIEGEDSEADISPSNTIDFQILLHIKVYLRLCSAIDQMVGILETRKIFKTI